MLSSQQSPRLMDHVLVCRHDQSARCHRADYLFVVPAAVGTRRQAADRIREIVDLRKRPVDHRYSTRPRWPSFGGSLRQERKKLLWRGLSTGLFDEQWQFAEDANQICEGFNAVPLAGGHEAEVDRSGMPALFTSDE
jgi:hypothetical protein